LVELWFCVCDFNRGFSICDVSCKLSRSTLREVGGLLVLVWRHKVSITICPKPSNSGNSVFRYIFVCIYIYIYVYMHIYGAHVGLILGHMGGPAAGGPAGVGLLPVRRNSFADL